MNENSFNPNLQLTNAKLAMISAFEDNAKASSKQSMRHEELTKSWETVRDAQQAYDDKKAQISKEWEGYKSKLSDYTTKIGHYKEAIVKAHEIADCMGEIAKGEEDELIIGLYAEMQRHAISQANELTIRKNELLEEKRALKEPDKTILSMMCENLKQLRSMHAEARDRYHEAKVDFTHKNEVYGRARAKYLALKNETGSTNVFTPTKFTPDRDSAIKAGVPEEYADNVDARLRNDGITDYYFGEDENHHHGHIVTNKDGNLAYRRMPKEKNLVKINSLKTVKHEGDTD
ncbi:hypothetical protein IKG73_02040 [Candidatus Saccharibacteria bacterium]|nr:hypothetical protein [Candidatus Saccharibacteria bacterium]